MTTVLYISYSGMGEPLGQSQVLAYLEKLAARHTISLISYEKSDASEGELAAVRRRVAAAGIEWTPLRYHKTPSGPATAYDIAQGIAAAARIIRKRKIRVVHARSYVASAVALAMKKMFKTRFVFDMRGFWADERVDGGLWPADGRMYQTAKWFERRYLQNADHVVSLTAAAIDEMRTWDFVPAGLPMSVIPTCADLTRFSPDETHARIDAPFVLGYVGSVGTWYLFDEVVSSFQKLQKIRPSTLMIINRNEHEAIRKQLTDRGVSTDAYTLESVSHADVPDAIRSMHAGAFYIRPCYSKTASAPTKMAELLGCGVPCLANRGVGDMEAILEDNGVGVTLEDFSERAHEEGVNRIIDLASQEGIADKCRDLALRLFSLRAGADAYDEIYNKLS